MKLAVKKMSPKEKAGDMKWGETVELLLMTLPGILLLLVFNYLPMFGSIIAFKDYNPNKGILGSEWCGLKNFEFFFTSSDAFRVIRNTVGYSLVFIVVGLITCVGLALMFYSLRSQRSLKFYNTVAILPNFLSIIIISYLVYILLDPVKGIANQIIVALGGEKIQWYLEPKYWPFILTITRVWQTVGMGSVIYYAALMGMDEALIEAAKIDGANKWHQIWNVMIPHLMPTIIIQTILNIGNIFTGDFGLFYQIPKDVGALYETTDIINTYTFRALQSGSLAKSAAVGLFQSLIGFLLIMIANGVVRKIDPERSLF